ncbi:MAG: PEP/pyruvate-binding domain-containing protein [Pseudomonadota bacterium]
MPNMQLQSRPHLRPQAALFALLLSLLAAPLAGAEPVRLDLQQMREWIDGMKNAARGPFARIRWFCLDGTILPPKEGACSEHGGGVQHGEWNAQTHNIREQGYLIANLLTDLNTFKFIGAYPQLDELRQVLLEQFLILIDDGWVFRQARFYRGALQVEDERAAARLLLLAMVQDPDWQDPARFLLLREAARLLPVGAEPPVAATVRQLAIEIAEADPGFQSLRVKLHGLPDASDPQRVRDYAAGDGLPELAAKYRRLAAELDTLYAPRTAMLQLEALRSEKGSRPIAATLDHVISELQRAPDLQARLDRAAAAAQTLRHMIWNGDKLSPPNQLRLLQANIALEQEVYAVANQLIEQQAAADRHTRLSWLRSLLGALYASGLLSEREWQAADARLEPLIADDQQDIDEYHATLQYLMRVPQWAQRALEFQFGPTIEHWLDITPLAAHFVPDRLRGSPLLAYTRIADVLLQDAEQLAGTRQYLFERRLSGGLRALNPGLRRGALLAAPGPGEDFRRDGIYLLPSTTPELPPIAGILTRGEGSSLSHVQLLARNLGIPNVVVDERVVEQLKPHIGARIVLAVSPQGTVQITADGPHWDRIFGRDDPDAGVVIRPDLQKLDLARTQPLSLEDIRASDSGRIVGPKAANLGELRHYYPDAVNPGVVIPFGVFRALLDQPLEAGGPPVFEWLRAEYARLRTLPEGTQRQAATGAVLERLRQWLVDAEPGAEFRSALRTAMDNAFGDADHVGVFVRSDTNVEDLPGFSGAGLNLTLPNVVGFDAVVRAIQKVWASPFTERAYAWRQAHMEQPEHVYPAVLLLKTFASEKSGVLVTADVDSGDRQWLSIAVNEGVGGAVEGQAAEELRVRRSTGAVRLLAQATAPLRAEPVPAGGMRKVPASGRAQVLEAGELMQLRTLADDIERRFPLPAMPGGAAPPADIEFGFRDGHLALFQIRPFVESQRALRSQYLIDIDRSGTRSKQAVVDLLQVPTPARDTADGMP